MRILIKGGRLLDPGSSTDRSADVIVDDGFVSEIGSGLSAKGSHTIDADGAVVTPGFVDLHVHMREPGREDEETIASGSAAAVAGGFTAVVAMPNTDPVCDNASIAEKVAGEARAVGLTEVVPAGSITKGLEGNSLSAIGEMVRSAARVRIFTDDGKGVQDARLLRRAMEYIRGFDAVCAEHCEDALLAADGQMNEGDISELLGLKGIPSEAEEVALARDLALARLTGVSFHALHVSTEGSVDLIRRAKALGARVTAEATPHHFSLTDAELLTYSPLFKVNPPLRSKRDLEAIRRGLADGTIDAIATDHAPHSPEEKDAEFEIAPPGMLGLETAFAVGVTHLVEEGVLDLRALVELMTLKPARIARLDGQGQIARGAPANIAIVDPAAEWTVDPSVTFSKSRNTPYAGRTLKGKVLSTIFRGQLVYADGAVREGELV